MKELIDTLNEIYEKNSFSTRKHINLEKMNLVKFDINKIIYGRKAYKINNKEIFIGSNDILIYMNPYCIKEDLFNKTYKKSIKKVLRDMDAILKELTYQEFINYTNHSIDIFINGIKKNISSLKFIFNNNYNLYIKIPNNLTITDLYIFEKGIKLQSVYTKSSTSIIPMPYNNKNDYMLFINGLNKTTYTTVDNTAINTANNGDIIEIIQFINTFNKENIDMNKTYYNLNSQYELSLSSLLIFSTNDNILLDTNIEQKTNNIIKFNSNVDISKYIFYPNVQQIHHKEENYITKYIELFGIEDLITKLNNSTLSLSLLEYLNSINTLNNSDIFNISESKYRELYHPNDYNPITKEEYEQFLNLTFQNILKNYNLGLYDLYIKKFIIEKDKITFNANIYLNRKIIYQSNFSNGDISDWLNYQNGSATTAWLQGIRYLKRINNNYPNGVYKILNESIVNYITTFNFVISADTSLDLSVLSLGLVDSTYTGKIIYLNISSGNEYITIRSMKNGIIDPSEDEIVSIDFSFQSNYIYTIKLVKNIQKYELYIYNTETNEEASFSIKEDLYQRRIILSESDISVDRLLIQGSSGLMYNNIQIRNISVIDQSLPPKSSLLIEQTPFTLSLPNIQHIIDKPSYIFMIQTNKDMTDKILVTNIDGVRVSYSLQTALMNYDAKYGLQNYFTLLIEKNIFSLQGGEKIEIEFFDPDELSLVTEYVYPDQEAMENSILTISKSDGPQSYLMDVNGDYILDSNGDYIMVYVYDANKYKYIIYKNGRYISYQYYNVTEDNNNIYINLNFHIEYQDIITIEYQHSERHEIYYEKQIDPSGICIITEHNFPLTVEYYDFYINGKKLSPEQIESLAEHTIHIKNSDSLYNLEIIERENITNNFTNSYVNENTVLDNTISAISKSDLVSQLGFNNLIENEFDNIIGS
jgi:hypothetical protein